MRVELTPSVSAGKTVAPPSKSMAHRYLIVAALCKGKSLIHGIHPSEDILATVDCLRALGVRVELKGTDAVVYGGTLCPPSEPLQCRESGSTLRFFIPICLLLGAPVTLCGSPRLMERPLSVYEALCVEQGFRMERGQGEVTVCGCLKNQTYRLDGSVSSQFISGLLFALATFPQKSRIELAGEPESRSYIDLTVGALRSFGFEAQWESRTVLSLGGEGTPQELTVEGDYSNAAFFDALNLLGGRVEVEGLDPASMQGDRVYRACFDQLAEGCPTVSLKDCPDLGPVLMMLAAALHGAVFTHTERLKIKESDRGAAMAAELKKCGAEVVVEPHRIVVVPSVLHAPTEPVCGHNDHRIVMSMAVLLSRLGGVIEGAEAVAKSLPDFFDRLASLGINAACAAD